MEKVCRNSKCGVVITSEKSKSGWLLSSGGFAELCESCGSAYEQRRFCELFHTDEDGWKNCKRCKKRFHCGCIASIHSIRICDDGGIECIDCAEERGNLNSESTQIQHHVSFLISSQRCLNLPLKTWNESWNSGPGQWQHPSSQMPSIGQAELSLLREMHEMNTSKESNVAENNEGDDSITKGKGLEDMGESGCSRKEQMQRIFSTEGGHTKTMANSCLQFGVTSLENLKCGEVNTQQLNNNISTSDTNILQLPTMECLNISLGSLTAKDVVQTCNDTLSPALGLALSSGSSEQSIAPIAFSQHQQICQKPPKSSNPSPSTGSESSKDMHTQICVAWPPGETWGKNQLLQRYWPRSTDQKFQLMSRDANSSITPLFHKKLSASDAGKIGRLVLPKASAEKYFPPISQPEGMPLTVQDVKGKDWIFQFRYWPNNNSRMYVLEGVTPCIQAMQLQAGDTVTFSRLDPEGKLIMGFRKSSISTFAQEVQTSTSGIGSFHRTTLDSAKTENISGDMIASVNGKEDLHMDSAIGQANTLGAEFSWYKSDRTRGKSNDSSTQSLLTPDTKRSRNLCAKSKRLCMDNGDALELKLTWEEAQDLLHPPPNVVPSIVMIEGHEFEEYEEPPVLGKRTFFIVRQSGEKDQWAQCDECGSWRRLPLDVNVPRHWTCADNSWDSGRASCLSPQEISSGEFEDLLRLNKDGLKGKNTTSGLQTLANAVDLDENANIPVIAQTTKHPRHRPGCTCIVCIQPPSGKGPKHKPTCTCTVCSTVKRRFKTLMMRRKKKQSEREAENARKRQNPAKEGQEPVSKRMSTNQPLENASRQRDEDTIINKSPVSGGMFTVLQNTQGIRAIKEEFGVSKGQIDLNCHPEHDEELTGGIGQVSMMRLLHDANLPLDIYLKQQGFPGLICNQSGSIPMMALQNNTSEQRLDGQTSILPAVPSSEHNMDEHPFLCSRKKSEAGPASFLAPDHNL